MKKNFIKMNDNDDNISLGNLFRIIKEMSKNKTSALQTELFCILFEIEEINDTTVNNYCVGCRRIGDDYKQKYINKQKNYSNDKEIFYDIVINIISIIDGRVYVIDNNKEDYINSSNTLKELCFKLYNICKNDKSVSKDIIEKLDRLLREKKYYDVFVEILFYIVLYKKQPVYESDLKKEAIESILNDTYISCSGLQEYLALKLRESINYDYSLKKMALSGNAYACFEVGSNEYCGYVKGYPRYEEAYKYLEMAANYNHAGACYMIGNMFYRGFLGNKSNDDLKVAYDYLVKASQLGNVASLNIIGLMYLNGIYPVEKNEDKALDYFKQGASNNYAYSLNNLGSFYEKKGNMEVALDYYLKSAALEESWACNKVGQFYSKGEVVSKDIGVAYKYYEKAILGNYRTLCYYAYYNLANIIRVGNPLINVNKDVAKALEYYEIASNHGIIEASMELFLYYILDYLKNKDDAKLEKILSLKNIIESNEKFDDKYEKMINSKMEQIRYQKTIDIDWFFE